MMEELKELLRYAFQTGNPLTMPVSAPGSAGMETCFVNLVQPGDKVVVCVNGVFGGRMKENVERCGGTAILVEDAWGTAVDPDKVEAALKANPDARILAFVHAETSTGAISDAKTLAEIARRHDCLTIVDTVTSLAGSPLKVDEWGLDAVYSGTQKCLSCVPGLSPVTFNERALDVITTRNTCAKLVHGPQPGAGLLGRRRQADLPSHRAGQYAVCPARGAGDPEEEGIENSWARHRKNHEALKAGIEAMGLEFVVPEGQRLPQLNAVTVPAGVDEAAVRGMLLQEYNLEIGAGLGAMAGKIWRIGLMGYAQQPQRAVLPGRARRGVVGDGRADRARRGRGRGFAGVWVSGEVGVSGRVGAPARGLANSCLSVRLGRDGYCCAVSWPYTRSSNYRGSI